MTEKDRIAAAYGGVDVDVSFRDGSAERVKVVDLPARKLTSTEVNFLSAVTKHVAVVELCTDLTADRIDLLTDQSLEALASACHERNGERAIRLGEKETEVSRKMSWAVIEKQLPELMAPMLKQMRSILERSLLESAVSQKGQSRSAGKTPRMYGNFTSGKKNGIKPNEAYDKS